MSVYEYESSLHVLGPVRGDGKVIPRSYGSIFHLPGSKMVDKRDKMANDEVIYYFTKRRKKPTDLVIITEKVDGMNCSVLKRNDLLYPLVRKGYDVRTNRNEWIRNFARFVEDNYTRFMDLLKEDERLCGEWMLKTHTLDYNLKTEPFIVFDLIQGTGDDSKRERYLNFLNRVTLRGFVPAGLIHIGEAMSQKTAYRLCGNGYHGVVGKPEGVVYRYEDENGYVCSAKYVANPLIGNDEYFRAEDDHTFNKMKDDYRIYIPRIKLETKPAYEYTHIQQIYPKE